MDRYPVRPPAVHDDYIGFLSPGDMPGRINEYLTKTGQNPIIDKGQMARMILENLAGKFAETIKKLEDVTGKPIDFLHIVGGGSQNSLLNQLTADATGKTVTAGPVEATAAGNILLQAGAAGQISDLTHARKLIRNSFTPKQYLPENR